jgi:glycerophosphoryl diester phosphodiesterase
MESEDSARADEPASSPTALARAVLRDFRRTWPQLAVTEVLARAAGFVVLVPLTALLMRMLVGGGQQGVLTDEGILLYLLGPEGIALLVLGGALRLGILFAEAAGLITIGYGALEDRRVSWVAALRHAAGRAPVLAGLAAQMVARGLLVAAPLLGLAGGVYALLLTEHDINYYLADKPRAFWIAAALIGALLALLAAALLVLLLRWLLAIPMVLFERRGPREALKASAQATRGRRRELALWLIGWWLASSGVSAAAAALIGLAHRVVVPTESTPLPVLAAAIGGALALITLVDWVMAMASASLLGLLVARLYARYARPGGLEQPGFGPRGSLGERAEWRVPRRGLVWGGLAAVAVAAASAYLLVESIEVERDVAVAAHRGGAAARPENTLAAFEHAISVRADWVELDVQETADGVVTVLHDEDFLRVGRNPGKIWQLTRAQVDEIDVGSSFSPEYADQRAPTLAEVLAACKDRVHVLIELKDYGHGQRLEERVVELVEAAGMTDQIRVMSLSPPCLQRARDLRPTWTYGRLIAVALGNLARLNVDFLAVRAPLADHRLIRRAHDRGRQVYVWTIDEPARMSAMISRGVDVLLTDEPATAREAVADYAELGVVERLLLAAGVRFGLVDEEQETPVDDA